MIRATDRILGPTSEIPDSFPWHVFCIGNLTTGISNDN
jgi:hypothetical protein